MRFIYKRACFMGGCLWALHAMVGCGTEPVRISKSKPDSQKPSTRQQLAQYPAIKGKLPAGIGKIAWERNNDFLIAALNLLASVEPVRQALAKQSQHGPLRAWARWSNRTNRTTKDAFDAKALREYLSNMTGDAGINSGEFYSAWTTLYRTLRLLFDEAPDASNDSQAEYSVTCAKTTTSGWGNIARARRSCEAAYRSTGNEFFKLFDATVHLSSVDSNNNGVTYTMYADPYAMKQERFSDNLVTTENSDPTDPVTCRTLREPRGEYFLHQEPVSSNQRATTKVTELSRDAFFSHSGKAYTLKSFILNQNGVYHATVVHGQGDVWYWMDIKTSKGVTKMPWDQVCLKAEKEGWKVVGQLYKKER